MIRLAYALGLLEVFNQFPKLLYTSGYGGAIAAYLWKEAPFVAYFVLAFMGSISDTLGEAAENLGASPLRSFFHVTLPLSVPVIARAFLIIFIFAFGGYELPLLLGAGPLRAFWEGTLPSLLPGILASMSMGFILSYSQYFTTLMVDGGRIKTIDLVLIPYIQSGDRALSSVYCVAFVGSALLVFHILESLIQSAQKREGIK